MAQSITINADCMDFMRTCRDKQFDLAIVDPPFFEGVANENFYGGKFSTTGIKRLCSSSKVWDKGIPTRSYYKELKRVSRHQIIWGINYFNFGSLPAGRIVWDKKNDTSTFSNCEIALCSLIESVKIYRFLWNGMLQENMKNKENRIHPTQKPIALYKWLLQNYAKPGDTILDTHMGSQSSRIAAYDLGFDYTGVELDLDYYNQGNKRFNTHISQQTLFAPTQLEIPKQTNIFNGTI